MQNELEIKVVVTEPKKRKRGRPKKGTGTGETTKEKILKSKASICQGHEKHENKSVLSSHIIMELFLKCLGTA